MSKDSSLTNLELKPSDANIMIRFVGEFNSNLKFIEKMYDVKIFQNGNNLKIFIFPAPIGKHIDG